MKTIIVALIACTLAGCVDDPTAPRIWEGPPQAYVMLTGISAKALATGSIHSCAIRLDDMLECWGYNTLGQATVPGGLGTVTAVEAGDNHTCAIKTDNTLSCWGWNTSGQTSIPGGLGTVKQVAAGYLHTCAIKSDNTLVCWGGNSSGQTTNPAGLGTVKDIDAGRFHTCAIKTDNTVACWGNNQEGQSTVSGTVGTAKDIATGDFHSCAVKTDNAVVCWGGSGYNQSTVPSGISADQITAGAYFSCAVETDATLTCWGRNDFSQSTPPAGLGTVKLASAGWGFNCAIRTDDVVVCWAGSNSNGQLNVPQVPKPTGIASAMLAAGSDQTCAIRADGTLVCWGRDDLQQSTPPGGMSTVKQVSSGGHHACAIKSDDTLACWGYSGLGRLPIPAGLGTVFQVAAGETSTCAIKSDATIVCWGHNSGGQTTIPGGLGTVKQVAAGDQHTCAIKTDDTLACWGSNLSGQMTIPGGLGTVQQVAARTTHTCAIKSNATLACWGSNANGQTAIPIGLGTVKQVATGVYHTCAIKTDDTLACWGSNSAGQTTIPDDLGTVKQVTAGREHTCVLDTTDTPKCWGYNGYGQTNVPVQVRHFLPSATFVAPASAETGRPFELALTGAAVITPEGTISAEDAGIQYAFDCGAGYGSFSSNSSANCTAGAVGSQTVKGKVQDADGDAREYSANVDVTAPAAPDAPASPVVTQDWDEIPTLTLTWSDLGTNEDEFYVQRRSRPEGGAWSNYSQIGVAAENATSFEDASVAQSTTYQYRIKACNEIGCSAFVFSAQLNAGVVPGAPTAVTATGVADGAIDLAWVDSDVESRYEIQRRQKDGTWSAYATLAPPRPANSESFSDTGLDVAVHQYRVRACNLIGCSPYTLSNAQLATGKPVAPTNVVATALSGTSVQVTWTDASNNETRFTVQRRMHNGTSWEAWGTIGSRAANATSFTDTSAAPVTTYQYRLRALNGSGGSAYTVSNQVTTPN